MRSELTDPTVQTQPIPPADAPRPAARPVWEVLVDHRRWQRLLAGVLTGNLDAAGTGALRAHVRDCPTCRSDLTQLAPAVGVLPLADPDRLESAPPAPEELYRTVMRGVRRERRRTFGRRLRRRAVLGLATLALIAALVAALALLPSGMVPLPARGEPIPLHPLAAGVNVLQAQLTARPWGVELRFTATGLAAGERHEVSFVTRDGTRIPAGGVLGSSGQAVAASVSGPLRREQATQVLVTTAAGEPVLHADLLGAKD